LRPFFVGASRQPSKSFLGEGLRDGGGTQALPGFLKRALDVIDGVILFTQRNDTFSGGIGFGRAAGTFRRRLEKHAIGILAELMAEDAKTAVAVAEALSRLLGGQPFDEERAQRFILTVCGVGGFEEGLG